MAVTAASLMVTVGADTSAAESELTSFGNKLGSIGKKLALTGGALTAGVTVPLMAVAGKAVSMAARYEQSMSMIQYSTQASGAEMELLSAQALQLGADSVFSAEEVAEAQLSLAKAGMKSNKIMGAMPGIIDLAAAANMDLNEAAETTSEVLSMWNLEVEKSTEVANMLAGAANGTTADVADFTMGIKQSGAVLSGYGVPLDDTLTMMGLLANAGLKGSDAGTSLKTMFMSLAAPTDRAATLLNELGVAIYDNNGVMRSSEDILGNLRSSLGALSAADRNAAMKDIFGTDGMRAANIMMEATAQEWTDLNEQINAEGNASGMAAARMSGLAGALEGLSGSVDTFLLSSAQPFMESLAGWVDQISAAIDWFGTLDPQLRTMALTIGALAAAAGPALIALGAVAAAIGAIGVTGMLAILAISGLALAWGFNIGDMQTKTAAAIPAIQEWLTKLSTDVTAVGSAIQTAFANTSFPTLDELWKDFQAGDGNLIADKIRNAAYTLMVNLNTELNIAGKIDNLRDNILNGLTTAINGISFDKGSGAFAGLINKVTAGINGLNLDGISWDDVFTRILTAPITIAVGALKWVIGSESFEGLKTAVQGAIGEIQWGELGASFAGLGAAIGGQLNRVTQDIIADFNASFQKVKPIDFAWEEVGAVPEKTARGMTDAVLEYDWSMTGEIMGTMISIWISNEMRKLGALMKFGETWSAFDQSWNEFRDKIYAEIASGFNLDSFQSAWSELGAAIQQGFSEMIESLVSTAMGLSMTMKFDPVITKGPDPILSQQKNLMQPEFQWPKFEWPPFEWPKFEWPADPMKNWKWPEITAPKWLNDLWGLFGGGGGGTGGGGFSGDLQKQSGRGGGASKGRASMRPDDSSSLPLPTALNWGDYVTPLLWTSFIGVMTWDAYVPTLSWFSYVDNINWESYVPGMSWGDFVPSLSWGAYIPRLAATDVSANASGTSNFEGGMTWVGERGPELVRLPKGSRIWSHKESMAMADGGGITINVNVARLNSELDVESLANRVARVIQKRTR